MGRITMIELVTDYEDECDAGKCRASRGIEVVPRKMVEMIINKCAEIIDVYAGNTNYDCGRSCTAVQIGEYAESLLKQFEEDNE